MLLWISSLSYSEFAMVYVAIFLLPLGKAGQTVLRGFLENRLADKVSQMECKTEDGNTDDKKERDRIQIITNIWWCPALFAGQVLTVGMSYLIQSESEAFKFAALLMGGTALLFSFGCASYSRKSFEDMAAECDLSKIRRICLVALKKRKSRYPIDPSDQTSSNRYHWEHDEQKNHQYYKHGQELRLLPRVPRMFGWLDKAAIVKEQSTADSDPIPQREENEEKKKGDVCTVEGVREVKSLVPLMFLAFTSFFAHSVIDASANTFFVNQASYLRPAIVKYGDDSGNDISLLFVAKSIMRDMSLFTGWLINLAFEKLIRKSQFTRSKRIAFPIIRIGIGMVCSVICCIVAWRVETRRLYLMKVENIPDYENPDRKLPMTTLALVPQFLLVGLARGLLDGGLTNLILVVASKSMWDFGKSIIQMVDGSGKLFCIPLFLIFSSWINKTAQTSHLDRYYLMLAILNFVLFLAFGYVSFYIRYAYEGEFPNDEEIGKGQRSDDAQEEDSGSKHHIIKFGNSGSFNSGHRGSFRRTSTRNRDSK